MSDLGGIFGVLVSELPRYTDREVLEDQPFLWQTAHNSAEAGRATKRYFRLLKGMLTSTQYEIFLEEVLTDEKTSESKEIKIARGEIIVALSKAIFPDRVSAADDEAAAWAAAGGTPANRMDAFRLKVAQLKELVLKSPATSSIQFSGMLSP